jgi:hypothetical protein
MTQTLKPDRRHHLRRSPAPVGPQYRRRRAEGGDAWRVDDVAALFALPFNDLLFRAQQVHREHFDANTVQLSTLLSIKTGGCEEDCGYCPQSAHHDTGVKAEKLMDLEAVLDAGAPPRPTAPRASAWAPHGAARRTATWSR